MTRLFLKSGLDVSKRDQTPSVGGSDKRVLGP
jgi:hypothetical protein